MNKQIIIKIEDQSSPIHFTQMKEVKMGQCHICGKISKPELIKKHFQRQHRAEFLEQNKATHTKCQYCELIFTRRLIEDHYEVCFSNQKQRYEKRIRELEEEVAHLREELLKSSQTPFLNHSLNQQINVLINDQQAESQVVETEQQQYKTPQKPQPQESFKAKNNQKQPQERKNSTSPNIKITNKNHSSFTVNGGIGSSNYITKYSNSHQKALNLSNDKRNNIL